MKHNSILISIVSPHYVPATSTQSWNARRCLFLLSSLFFLSGFVLQTEARQLELYKGSASPTATDMSKAPHATGSDIAQTTNTHGPLLLNSATFTSSPDGKRSSNTDAASNHPLRIVSHSGDRPVNNRFVNSRFDLAGMPVASSRPVAGNNAWARVSEQPTEATQVPVAVDDLVSDLPLGTPGVVSALVNDIAPAGKTLDPTRVSLVAASVPDASCTDTDAQGDCIAVSVPYEGTWTANPTDGTVTFTPLYTFTRDPTPLSYTVRDNTGVKSNKAAICLAYKSPSMCFIKVANGDFSKGAQGWTMGAGWGIDHGRARNFFDNVTSKMSQSLTNVPPGELILDMTLGAMYHQAPDASLTVLLGGKEYAKFTIVGDGKGRVMATGSNGATVHNFFLTAGPPPSTFNSYNLYIRIPNYTGPSTANLEFLFSGGSHDMYVDNIALEAPCKMSISGTVFNDNNGTIGGADGGAGGKPLANIQVDLYRADGTTLISTTHTNASGHYTFPYLLPGTYIVKTNLPPTPGGQTAYQHVSSVDSTPGDGSTKVNLSTSDVDHVNFGMNQPPTAVATHPTPVNNPGGTVSVLVTNGFSGTDPSSGIVTRLTILQFPSNATSLTVGDVTYYPAKIPASCPTATCLLFPSEGITMPTGPNGVPSTPVSVDPIDGDVTVSIPFTVKDNAGLTSLKTTLKVPFFTSALPVTLVAFTGSTKDDHSVVLNWVTTEETNSRLFEIQHSSNAGNWKALGTVAAKGQSDELARYSFHHTTPLSGANLYRLRMVDHDNTEAYSQIVSVFTRRLSTALVVYPNPGRDIVRLKLDGSSDDDIREVRIIDLSGRTAKLITRLAQAGMDVSDLSPGVYKVLVTTRTGAFHISSVSVVR